MLKAILAAATAAALYGLYRNRHLSPSSIGSPFHLITGAPIEQGGGGGEVILKDGSTIPYKSQVDLDQITNLAALGAFG